MTGHPMIAGLAPSILGSWVPAWFNSPSYVSPRNFARAVTDALSETDSPAPILMQIHNGINELPDGSVKTSLLSILKSSEGKIDLPEAS
jgi:hypothetical protein